MSETYFNAIEALSRRRAEVSAEIVKQNEVVLELNRAIKILQDTVVLPGVCIVCNGTGCSTCEPLPELCFCSQCGEHAGFLYAGLCAGCKGTK